MIERLQRILYEKTHGVIHTRKETIYIITIIILIVILIISTVIKSSAV